MGVVALMLFLVVSANFNAASGSLRVCRAPPLDYKQGSKPATGEFAHKSMIMDWLQNSPAAAGIWTGSDADMGGRCNGWC